MTGRVDQASELLVRPASEVGTRFIFEASQAAHELRARGTILSKGRGRIRTDE